MTYAEQKCIEDCLLYCYDKTYEQCVQSCKAPEKRASIIVTSGTQKGGDIKLAGYIENTGDVKLNNAFLELASKTDRICREPDFFRWNIEKGRTQTFSISSFWNPFASLREGGTIYLYLYSGTEEVTHKYIRLDFTPDPTILGDVEAIIKETPAKAKEKLVDPIITIITGGEGARTGEFRNLIKSTKGDEIIVSGQICNTCERTIEIRTRLYIGDEFINEEPDTFWNNIGAGQCENFSISSEWKFSDITSGGTPIVMLVEQHAGVLDEESLGYVMPDLAALLEKYGLYTLVFFVIIIAGLFALRTHGIKLKPE